MLVQPQPGSEPRPQLIWTELPLLLYGLRQMGRVPKTVRREFSNIG